MTRRRLAELVDDCRLCDHGINHEACLAMDEAAYWPDPAPGHRLCHCEETFPDGTLRHTCPPAKGIVA